MPRCLLSIGAAGLAALPTLVGDSLRQTLDPARGNRIDPQKLLVIEAGCYLAAAGALVLAFALPALLQQLERFAARLQFSPARHRIHRRPSATPLERALMALFVVLAVLLPANLVMNREAGLMLAAEDGIIETGTALLYLLAAAANLFFAARFAGLRWTRWSLYGLAALYFVVGMEEMSWGQRFLGVSTPESLAALNVQGEITLHNLWSTSINQALGLGVTFVLLVLLPLLYRFWPTGRKLVNGLGLPVAPTSTVALYAAGVIAAVVIGTHLGTLGIGPRSLYGLQPHFDDEYLEFFLAFLFFTVAVGGSRLELTPECRPERARTEGERRTDPLP